MDKLEQLKLLGHHIRKVRESKGFSQVDLAYITGKERSFINKLENGRVNPSYIYLKEIATGLEIDIRELMPV